ncbi:phage Gp37/Gp68 family protein [Xanthobacter sp. VTT E-85241]|uniref:DUF5131 family protein n=1 Tax=Roseixanthobacter finlandensis TaxID=3119922 RepID=UPI0037285D19
MMAQRTSIEWTRGADGSPGATWNPIVGCSIVSPGCTNCYAMSMARRIEAMQPTTHYAGTTQVVNGNAVWTGKVALAPERILTQPLRWQKPRKIFVNSMGDLFHEAVPVEWIDRTFAVMNDATWHDFQVLTKRPGRMRAYLTDEATNERIADAQVSMGLDVHVNTPARNIWLGTSVEDQHRADERREDLSALAGDRWRTFVSYEPARGPVDWTGWEFLSWLISGGESGNRARPSDPDWHRAARDFCAAHGIPYLFKQWGEWLPLGQSGFTQWTALTRGDGTLIYHDIWRGHAHFNDGAGGPETHVIGPVKTHSRASCLSARIGKRAAGRLLDGIEYNGMPGAPQ